MRLPDWDGLAFGGINNSAVKTVVKVVWETWGREAASGLLDLSLIHISSCFPRRESSFGKKRLSTMERWFRAPAVCWGRF